MSVAAGSDIRANLDAVRERIASAAATAGRDPSDVTLVGVTKTLSVERIAAAIAAGLTILGENRVQEAEAKIPEIPGQDQVSWHLIGHLQSNKARQAIRLFDAIQSVDSLKLATRLNVLAEERARRLPVLIEVNTSGESSKSGFGLEELPEAVPALGQLPWLEIFGLMTIGPFTRNEDAIRSSFRSLRALRDELRKDPFGVSWDTLSMGMSDDFEIAIEEGSTMVRVGRALFGERA